MKSTARPQRFISTLRRSIAQTALIIAITALAFLALEFSVATIAPQIEETIVTSGESLGIGDSVLGYRYRGDVRAVHRGPEFDVEYHINSNGHRDATPHATPKPPGLTRILLVGDSFTFGQGMTYEKIWPSIIEQRLRQQGLQLDVVKTGVQGYSTHQEVRSLKQLNDTFEPDIVIITFLPNDLYANSAVDEPARRDLMGIAADKPRRQFHTVQLAQRILTASDQVYMRLYKITPWIDYYRTPHTPEFTTKVATTKALLREAKAVCDAAGADLIVLSVPQQFQVLAATHQFQTPELDVYQVDDAFTEFVVTENIEWIRTLETFVEQYEKDRRALFFRMDGHLNEAGNALLADHLTTILANRFAEDRFDHPHIATAGRITN